MTVVPPQPGPDDAFFWDGVADHKLMLRSCASCGRLQHPPTPLCPVCGSETWMARESAGRGRVYSWIVSHHPTQPDAAPRIVALVELEEGVRLVSNLHGIDPVDVRNDMPVEVCFVAFDGVVLPQFGPSSPTVPRGGG